MRKQIFKINTKII